MLQRLAENFQYSDLLNKAAREDDQYMRLAYIAAFNIAGHALSPFRTLKSFNPLLFETYELIDEKLGFKFISEQVSHHPAVSACFVEGEGYNYYANSNSKQKFLLTRGALEIQNIGKIFCNLTTFNETYSYNRPKVIARGLIMGKISIDFTDTTNVTNHNTGDVLETKWLDQSVVNGELKDFMGDVKLEIEGNWTSHLDVIYKGKKTRIWEKYMTDTYENYFFTDFSSNINYLSEELKAVIPQTDSRLRPDLRALEKHENELAASEKHRLEEKQRKKRKENEKNKNYKHIPMYFTETYDDITGDLVYVYNNQYWQDKANKNFTHFPEIY
jgi:hypothetical protein